MSGAEAILAIQLVVAAVAIAGSVASAVISRKALGNAVPDPDLKKHPTADEGSAAAWLFGNHTRVSGQLIYLSEIRLVPIPGEDKGKSPTTVAWNYEVDVGIAWCRNVCDEDPITRIWASGELIYARIATLAIPLPTVLVKSDESQWVSFDHWNVPFNTPVGLNCSPPKNPKLRLAGEGGTFFFATAKGSAVDSQMLLVQGQMLNVIVTISGSGAGNDGAFRCTHWERYDDPADNSVNRWQLDFYRGAYQYPDFADVASGEQICDPLNDPGHFTPGFDSGITLSFTVTGVSQYFPPGGLATYRGTDFQLPDGVIQSDAGIDSTPAFRGTCYTRISSLDITKWASTMPHFEAEVRVHATQQFVADAFDAVIARNEATTSYKVDTSSFPVGVDPVFGLTAMGPTSPTTTLKTLMQVYDVEAQERLVISALTRMPEPVLFFVPRDVLPVEQIDYDLTSAREAGDEGTVHATIKRATRDELPQEFILDYTEIERDLQPGSMSYSVATGGVRNTQKLSIPMATTQPGADLIVKKLLWKAINFHDKAEFTLPPTSYGITEGDRLQLNTPSDDLPLVCRVAQIDIGENGLLEVKADIDDDLIYEQYENGGYSDAIDTQVELPLNAVPIVVDIAPLTSTQAGQFGLYLANGVAEITGSITYSYYYSLDQINWSQPIGIQSAAVSGSATTALGPPDQVHAWDFVNTVRVRLRSLGPLESVTQEEVEQGLNWALLGTEVIGFMTATVYNDPDPIVGGNEYTLSGLLRGRNDTESQVGAHIVGLPFLLLPPSSQAVAFVPLEPSLYRLPLFITIVPSGSPVTDGIVIQLPPNAETLRPYSVHGTWGIKRNNGDVCVFATPRTRVPFRLLSELIAPFIEEGPASDYRADVYWLDGNTWIYARTITACDAQHSGQLAFDYNAGLQDIDLNQTGLLPPPYTNQRFLFEIRRTSDTIGDGREVLFCLENVGVEYDGDCTVLA
jgi:hypothetical protein